MEITSEQYAELQQLYIKYKTRIFKLEAERDELRAKYEQEVSVRHIERKHCVEAIEKLKAELAKARKEIAGLGCACDVDDEEVMCGHLCVLCRLRAALGMDKWKGVE